MLNVQFNSNEENHIVPMNCMKNRMCSFKKKNFV